MSIISGFPTAGADLTAGAGITIEGDAISVDNPVHGIYTLSQWNALTEEQKTSGTYFVDDGQGGGGSGLEIYSTEERRIGTWIDGKPIYQKTFYFGDINVSAGVTVLPITKSELEIDRVLGGFISTLGATSTMYDGNGSMAWMNNSTNLGISQRVSSSTTMCKGVIGVLEYTKTTDQATIELPTTLSGQKIHTMNNLYVSEAETTTGTVAFQKEDVIE